MGTPEPPVTTPNGKRHVAVFIRSLGGGGGAERMMAVLAGAIADRGHRVDLVLGRVEGNMVGAIPDNVRVIDLKGGEVLGTLGLMLRHPGTAAALLPSILSRNPPWILACAPALARYVRRERPDAMLTALNYTSITALWTRRVEGLDLRLVVSERNTLSQRAASGAGSVRALPGLVRHFYPWADALAAVSAGVAADLAEILGVSANRVAVTFNPVVTPEIGRQAAEALGHPWFAPGQPPVILAAGKLKQQKGFNVLLEAFARVRAGRPARLLILGEGPERGRLEQQARHLGVDVDVSLPGFVDNPFAFMSRSSVFVLSSAWEGLPAVLIQAMACGCPVVSTDCPSGPAEILDQGVYGPLVPVGDDAAMAEAIETVLDAAPSGDRLRRRADDFSVEPSTDRYLALLLGD